MKKWLGIVGLIVASGFLYGFGCVTTGGCHTTQSCYSVWQCYSSSITECQDKAKQTVDWKANPAEYWKVVGECQAGFCS